MVGVGVCKFILGQLFELVKFVVKRILGNVLLMLQDVCVGCVIEIYFIIGYLVEWVDILGIFVEYNKVIFV